MNSGVGEAYDSVAADYDRLLERDQWMRIVLWRHYSHLFHPGDRVIDMGCGTGIDTLFLAGRQIHVTALDASSGMIGQLLKKMQFHANATNIDARVVSADDFSSLPANAYDGLVSAFAGLNTVSDLGNFAANAHRLLRPQGKLVLHMLAPPGIWERLSLIRRGRWREEAAARRCREKIIVVCGRPLRHLLLPARDTYTQFFQPYFRLRRLYSLGFLWPYHWDKYIPHSLAALGGRMEPLIGGYPPFSSWGRFFVLEMGKN
ncbi:MAG TPA: methyltransferase domain-containing protein [Candidatus Angelobacter sp.]|nr:methyltransferase domain-containing protein [Candidatus Angelobacter sp.]